jgi:predicted transposase YbfD/YdcC
VKTDEKSNEITAIPALLEIIALKGCIVTIGAMGCQYTIAGRIVGAGADYLFSLKENQKALYEDVKTCFEEAGSARPDPNVAVHTAFDADHGRFESRFHGITGDVSWLVDRHPAWKSIKSIGVIDAKPGPDPQTAREPERTRCRRPKRKNPGFFVIFDTTRLILKPPPFRNPSIREYFTTLYVVGQFG